MSQSGKLIIFSAPSDQEKVQSLIDSQMTMESKEPFPYQPPLVHQEEMRKMESITIFYQQMIFKNVFEKEIF